VREIPATPEKIMAAEGKSKVEGRRSKVARR
jgi:hypothetical protein